jgi:hypothetical protein
MTDPAVAEVQRVRIAHAAFSCAADTMASASSTPPAPPHHGGVVRPPSAHPFQQGEPPFVERRIGGRHRASAPGTPSWASSRC